MQIIEISKTLPWVKISNTLAVICGVAALYTLAKISWLAAPQVSSVNAASQQVKHGQSKTAQQSVDATAIIAANLFGLVNQAPVIKEEVAPVVSDAPKTKLNIVLTGVVAVNKNDKAGAAIIESRGQQKTYVLNDKVDGTNAVVKQILQDRVIIRVGSRHETLMLDGFDYSQFAAQNTQKVAQKTNISDRNRMTGPSMTSPGRRSNGQRKVDNRKNNELSSQLKQTQQELSANPAKIFDYIRISPSRKGGQLEGYKLRPGKNPTLFRNAGFKTNDLAIEINGIPLTDVQQSLSVIKELRTLSEANIVVKRGDEQIEILFSVQNNGV